MRFLSETLAELLEHLKSGKRLSIGLSRYKHTSNDLGQSQQQIQTAEKSKQLKKVSSASSKKDHNGKPVILKVIKCIYLLIFQYYNQIFC